MASWDWGGVTGGVFGTYVVRGLIATVHPAGWLWICVGLDLLTLVVAYAVGRLVAANPLPEGHLDPSNAEPAAASEAQHGNSAIEGARLVFRSPYLLAIVGIVGLYEIKKKNEKRKTGSQKKNGVRLHYVPSPPFFRGLPGGCILTRRFNMASISS
jgi:hypothetical protein